MWKYSQLEGSLVGATGATIAMGYSGYGVDGKNNPAAQGTRDVGPIPRGIWDIGHPFDSSIHGPFCLPLVLIDPAQMGERDGFLIHGDSLTHPGEASHGCIILPKFARHKIWDSMDHQLEVVETISGSGRR